MTLGKLWAPDEDRPDGLYVLARNPDGELRSFLHFVRYEAGLSLDVMRRRGEEPNGLNEAMVVAALEHARAAGLREVSLNFAGCAHLMAPDDRLTLRRRLARFALRRVHGRFQLERLVRFNDKFFPVWRPRYLVYTGRARLPLAVAAVHGRRRPAAPGQARHRGPVRRQPGDRRVAFVPDPGIRQIGRAGRRHRNLEGTGRPLPDRALLPSRA